MKIEWSNQPFYREGVYDGRRGDIFAEWINFYIKNPSSEDIFFKGFKFSFKDEKLYLAYDDKNEVYWTEKTGFYFV